MVDRKTSRAKREAARIAGQKEKAQGSNLEKFYTNLEAKQVLKLPQRLPLPPTKTKKIHRSKSQMAFNKAQKAYLAKYVRPAEKRAIKHNLSPREVKAAGRKARERHLEDANRKGEIARQEAIINQNRQRKFKNKILSVENRDKLFRLADKYQRNSRGHGISFDAVKAWIRDSKRSRLFYDTQFPKLSSDFSTDNVKYLYRESAKDAHYSVILEARYRNIKTGEEADMTSGSYERLHINQSEFMRALDECIGKAAGELSQSDERQSPLWQLIYIYRVTILTRVRGIADG